MRKHVSIVWNMLILCLTLSSVSPANAMQVGSSAEADDQCSGNYSCSGETVAPDSRSPERITQPSSADPVQGLCGPIAHGRDYLARPVGLTCGAGQAIRKRERAAYSQEDLDRNFEFLNIGKTFQTREAAQKVLLREQTWSHDIPMSMTENWIYKRKTGGYINCAGRFGAEGGDQEQYQTTCYRKNREEHVVQRVIRKRRVCLIPLPPPPPPPPPPEDHEGGRSRNRSDDSYGSHSQPQQQQQQQQRRDPPPPQRRIESAPKARGEDSNSGKKRMNRGYDSGSLDIHLVEYSVRAPAWSIRRLADKLEWATPDSPTYGCAQGGWSERIVSDQDVNLTVDAPDLEYTCTKTRTKWCTWFEDQSDSQACPAPKTVKVNVHYKTPSDWNPNNPKYDDQLPNKFDLLMGESELVRVALNKLSEGLKRDITPSAAIANALPGRDKAWNNYQTSFEPRTLSCEYRDQSIDLNVATLGRNVQPAPNPLVIPKDEKGNLQAFEGTDSQGRPRNLLLMNPTRSFVLDRSNLSRVFGEDAASSADVKVSSDPALASSGISKKFWENTRFWMRLVWMDGKTKVKATLGRPFEINSAGAVGDQLKISLAGENGMRQFYKLAVPFEKFFGFLGGNVPLDPNKKYFIEIKVSQPGFNGIYLSGLQNDPTLSDEEKKLINDDAYSESMLIPLGQVSSTRTLMERFWDWRARMMRRP